MLLDPAYYEMVKTSSMKNDIGSRTHNHSSFSPTVPGKASTRYEVRRKSMRHEAPYHVHIYYVCTA